MTLFLPGVPGCTGEMVIRDCVRNHEKGVGSE